MKQTRVVEWIIGGLAALGGVTAFIVYLETKNHKKLELEILGLDRSIKELQLYKLKNDSQKA